MRPGFRAAESARRSRARARRACLTTSSCARPNAALWFGRLRRRTASSSIDAGYDGISSSRCCLRVCSALGLDPNDVEVAFRYSSPRSRSIISAARRTFSSAARAWCCRTRIGISFEDPPPPPPGASSTAALPPPERDHCCEGRRTDCLRRHRHITPVLIPGHTPGALGFVFDVKDGDRTHTGSAIRRLDSALCANLGRRPQAVPALDQRFDRQPLIGSMASNVEIQKSTRSTTVSCRSSNVSRAGCAARRIRSSSVRRLITAFSHGHGRVHESGARTPTAVVDQWRRVFMRIQPRIATLLIVLLPAVAAAHHGSAISYDTPTYGPLGPPSRSSTT